MKRFFKLHFAKEFKDVTKKRNVDHMYHLAQPQWSLDERKDTFIQSVTDWQLRDERLGTKPFQLISLGNCSGRDMVLNNFDLDVVQNYYDGRQLVVTAARSIATRQMNLVRVKEYRDGMYMEQIMKRWAKYEAKGFEGAVKYDEWQ